MSEKRKRKASRAAFIPIGIALMVIGMNNNSGLIGAGAVFLVIGMSGVGKNRKTDCEDSQTPDDEQQN